MVGVVPQMKIHIRIKHLLETGINRDLIQIESSEDKKYQIKMPSTLGIRPIGKEMVKMSQFGLILRLYFYPHHQHYFD